MASRLCLVGASAPKYHHEGHTIPRSAHDAIIHSMRKSPLPCVLTCLFHIISGIELADTWHEQDASRIISQVGPEGYWGSTREE